MQGAKHITEWNMLLHFARILTMFKTSHDRVNQEQS